MALFSPFGRTLSIFFVYISCSNSIVTYGVNSMQPANRKIVRELKMGKLRKKPCIFVFVVASLYGVRSKKSFYKRKFILMKVVK